MQYHYPVPLVLLLLVVDAAAFTTVCSSSFRRPSSQQLSLSSSRQEYHERPTTTTTQITSTIILSRSNFLSTIATTAATAATLTAQPVQASEIGVEVEAPTLFTGENVMICKKRGPLGACLQEVPRTMENDNDKAKSYFKDPAELVRENEAAITKAKAEFLAEQEGNVLIQKLKQQSVDNKEKNDLTVQRKTFENDQSATFGPFDRQVLIMNTDGKTFTLLENPQAMRLKKAGFINDKRQFLKQPTEEELEQALPAAEEGGGIGGAIQGLFGGN